MLQMVVSGKATEDYNAVKCSMGTQYRAFKVTELVFRIFCCISKNIPRNWDILILHIHTTAILNSLPSDTETFKLSQSDIKNQLNDPDHPPSSQNDISIVFFFLEFLYFTLTSHSQVLRF